MALIAIIALFAGLTLVLGRVVGPSRMRWIVAAAGLLFALLLVMVLTDAGSVPGNTRTQGFLTMVALFGAVSITGAIDYYRRMQPLRG